MPIPIISIVGKTNSGKTTLIEKIIPELINRGYRIGTIKHDVHHFEIDHEGKDTWRHTKAGAETVLIASSEKIAMVKNSSKEYSIDELVEWLFKDVDIVITEGYKKQNKTKIEITQTGELLCCGDDKLLAIVINYKCPKDIVKPNVPCFDIMDVKDIVNLIENNIIENKSENTSND